MRFLSWQSGPMFQHAIETARQFADRLDQRRYDELAGVLDPHCVYEFRDSSIQGAQEIIETYRANTEWGFDVFDRIEFESDVSADSETSARVRFSDRLVVGEAAHRHASEQVVTVNASGRIVRIEHCDLPGETEALHAFLAKCGVSRPSDQAGS